jgi:hypothetical protein
MTTTKAVLILGCLIISLIFVSGCLEPPKTPLEKFQEHVTEDLADYGYEVINVGYIDHPSTVSIAYVTMKSLGNREDQVRNGWLALYSWDKYAGFNNTNSYMITILAPTNECIYTVGAKTLNDFFSYANQANNDQAIEMQLYQQIDKELYTYAQCR